MATAACEASASARLTEPSENPVTWRVSGSTALISCSTPITSFSWFFIGTTSIEREW